MRCRYYSRCLPEDRVSSVCMGGGSDGCGQYRKFKRGEK